ncbi:MAG: DUF5069 domain-containing protein [Vulcanimicrobiaceae bacterium]
MTTTGTTGTTTTPKVVPLISSGTAGPLGAVHLPRLWAKLSLARAGMLADGYDECGPGFDQMTLNGLNLDRQKVIDFVRTQKPTYMAFERWVIEQNGGNIDQATIDKHNAAIAAYNHANELAAQMRQASGVSDATISDAVTLNTLEDLDEIYRQAGGR